MGRGERLALGQVETGGGTWSGRMALTGRARCSLDGRGQFLCGELAQAWEVDSGEWVRQESSDKC